MSIPVILLRPDTARPRLSTVLQTHAKTCLCHDGPQALIAVSMGGAEPGLAKSDRLSIAVRARSSLARPSRKAAPLKALKALKKLKGCLCSAGKEEQLPLFQVQCTDFKRSIDAACAPVGKRYLQAFHFRKHPFHASMQAAHHRNTVPEGLLTKAMRA